MNQAARIIETQEWPGSEPEILPPNENFRLRPEEPVEPIQPIQINFVSFNPIPVRTAPLTNAESVAQRQRLLITLIVVIFATVTLNCLMRL
jgi:hypothetical protein